MSETDTDTKKEITKKKREKPKVRYPLKHSYAQYHGKVGAFGELVIAGLERKHKTIESVVDATGVRKQSFLDVLHGTQKTMVMSVEQVIELANLLDLDPVSLIEAYLLDSSRIQLSPVVAHTSMDLYRCFQWYRGYLGQGVSDERVAHDVGVVLYLTHIYDLVRRDQEKSFLFRKLLDTFRQTVEYEQGRQGVEACASGE